MKFYIIFTLVLLGITTSVCHAEGASIGIVVSQKNIHVGDTVQTTLVASTPTTSINAVSGTLSIPDGLTVKSIDTTGSIVTFWSDEPKVLGRKIVFEGIVLNPGYRGNAGKIASVTFFAKRAGDPMLIFDEGSLLSNDGKGTNVLDTLGSLSLHITEPASPAFTPLRASPSVDTSIDALQSSEHHTVAFPVITSYDVHTTEGGFISLEGQGEPGALTKLLFQDTREVSFGSYVRLAVQTNKKRLEDVFIKNNEQGQFFYTSPNNLLAGAYVATPFLVDEDTSVEQPGMGVQVVVPDSSAVLITNQMLLGALGIALCVLFLFIYRTIYLPWRKTHLLRRLVHIQERKRGLVRHAQNITLSSSSK